MGSLWLKIKVWTKVIVFFALLSYAALFIVMNSARQEKPWFWIGHDPDTSVLILVLCAFLTGVVGTILLRTTFKTLRQVRVMRDRTRSDRLQREVDEMRMKASKLRSRPAAGVVGAAAPDAPAEPFDQHSTEGELP